MTQEDEEWENYLLSIGVVNLNDDAEISRKLEEVERSNPEYQKMLKEAVEEIMNHIDKKSSSQDKPLESIKMKSFLDLCKEEE